eukprot:SAG31_NODE_5709_length_2368_cov_12.639048_2_plen_167_part_00
MTLLKGTGRTSGAGAKRVAAPLQRGGAPPSEVPTRPPPPPPPPPPTFAAASSAATREPPAAHTALLELVPFFDETKQFLKKVETVDKSQPRLEAAGLRVQSGWESRDAVTSCMIAFENYAALLLGGISAESLTVFVDAACGVFSECVAAMVNPDSDNEPGPSCEVL